MIDDTFVLETPENVQVDFELAGIGSRFFAMLIDQLWLLAVRVLLGLIGLAIFNASGYNDETGNLLLTLAILLIFATTWGYFIFFEISWNGQTPGKRRVGLRVVDTNGLPLSASSAIIRNILRIVDYLPSLYTVGIVTMFFNRQSRRLGDLAAGTLVIFEQTEVSLDQVKSRNRIDLSRVVMSEQVLDLPVAHISPALHQMAEDFLARRREDQMQSSDAMVAQQLLANMYGQMDLMKEYERLRPPQIIDFVTQICARLRKLEESEA